MKKMLLYIVVTLFCFPGCDESPGSPHVSQTSFIIDYRDLSGVSDGIAIIELDPESPQFGKITSRIELGKDVLPHHIYFDRRQKRVYNTALGFPYLYELKLKHGPDGRPYIAKAEPINTGGNQVGEDMFFTNDGRYFVTFMGGRGNEHGGTVGVFRATDNRLIHTIEADMHHDSTKFIMHPHGISMNESTRRLMVTSTIHPGLTSGVGSTVTLINADNYSLIKTYKVADAGAPASSPVEVLLLRNGFLPYALVTTMLGGDVWIAPRDPKTNNYGEFTKFFDGSDHGLGWALEFYVSAEKLLYVSFAKPGVVKVFDIAALPAVKVVRTLQSDPGAHHMAFFKTKSGRDVVAVQNNMLNLPDINAGTIAVFDVKTGERLATAQVKKNYNIQPESIEWANGNGHYMHH
ncbi:hypothetical protein EGT74_12635 [Chitinophaga lutea]|uniref:YncE family protein n=1 Tax=Chitinophaga lutea TaxID=2488634 RepID=A0A3N4PK68_9BACT|nr:hypothetical protein [Chitinophaga lutea]RPE07918.1 hypothetical protein EGT74_12635 [Chitinophaga lutea]